MCFGAEAAWVPAAIAAVSAGATGVAQGQALKRQDRETAANILQQSQRNREAGERVNRNVQELKTSTPDDAIAQRREAYTSALRRAQPGVDNAALPSVGGASMRFAEDVGTARDASATSGAEDAGLMARLDAPGLQRQQEAQRAAGTASDLSLISGQAGGENAMSRIRLAGIAPNPWLTAAGQIGSNYAAGRAAGGGSALGAATPAAAGVPTAPGATGGLMPGAMDRFNKWLQNRGAGSTMGGFSP
jgi:hypothetical protein